MNTDSRTIVVGGAQHLVKEVGKFTPAAPCQGSRWQLENVAQVVQSGPAQGVHRAGKVAQQVQWQWGQLPAQCVK